MILKTWDIARCGWATFERECVALTSGNHTGQFRVKAVSPGRLMLIDLHRQS